MAPVLRAVRETMVNNEVKWKKGDTHLFDSTQRIERRIDMLTENLSRKSWRKRFSHTVVLQRVPEIWDDVIARKAFEESFFESLAELSYKGKRRRSSAASQLLCAVGIKDESTAQKIQDKLEESLTDPDWYDRSFAHMTYVSRWRATVSRSVHPLVIRRRRRIRRGSKKSDCSFPITTGTAFAEELRRIHRTDFLGHCRRDELVERYAVTARKLLGSGLERNWQMQ